MGGKGSGSFKRKQPKIISGKRYWKCSRCKSYKMAEDFAKNASAANGLTSYCRECSKAMAKRHRENMTPEQRERSRVSMRRAAKRWRERNLERHRAMCRDYMSKNKDKESQVINRVINKEIIGGRMERGTTCAECGATGCRIEGHHYDYSKPLEVVWLCTACHGMKHRRIKCKNTI